MKSENWMLILALGYVYCLPAMLFGGATLFAVAGNFSTATILAGGATWLFAKNVYPILQDMARKKRK